jgi:hypothetical protein
MPSQRAYFCCKSDVSVSIGTRLPARGPGNRGTFFGKGGELSLRLHVQFGLYKWIGTLRTG